MFNPCLIFMRRGDGEGVGRLATQRGINSGAFQVQPFVFAVTIHPCNHHVITHLLGLIKQAPVRRPGDTGEGTQTCKAPSPTTS